MSMTDLPIVSMLKTRMRWHETRQKVLAENVANADMPGFKPRELNEPDFAAALAGGGTAAGGGGGARGGVAMERTSPMHLAGSGFSTSDSASAAARSETRPSGNAVNLEDEMLKVARNQSDYQLAASLYQKSLGMLRVAAGRKG